jgi:sugar O-acyltransferase (sialic acid O-acetyltransferase NeuD family)
MNAEGASRGRLLILGAGSFGQEVAALTESDGRHEVVAFVESLDRSKIGRSLDGLPIIGHDDIAALAPTHLAVCALGTTRRRRWIEQVAALGFGFAIIRHASAQLLRGCDIGKGSVVSAGAVVAAGAQIGAHVIVNRGTLIGHHASIGDYVTIAPGVNIGGSTAIGAQTFLGMGAIVLNNLTVGAGAIVGAGAVVTRDVPERTQVVGCPAHIIRRNVEAP